jgi:hypothetical protein
VRFPHRTRSQIWNPGFRIRNSGFQIHYGTGDYDYCVSNPFTRSITHALRSRALRSFVQHWDALEALVIRVFRGKAALASDEAELITLRHWLHTHFPDFQAALEPRWRASRVGHDTPGEDPFAALLAIDAAQTFVDNWAALRQLPAAREALNQFVIDESGAHAPNTEPRA